MPTAGIRVDLPEQIRELKGVLKKSGGNEYDTGVVFSELVYFPMTEARYNEIMRKNSAGTLTERDYNFYNARCIDLLILFTIDGGRTLEDIDYILEHMGLSAEHFRQIGSVGAYNYYCIADPLPEILDFEATFAFDPGFREEYDALVEALGKDTSWASLFEPRSAEDAATGTTVRFETVDLDGNPVRSEDIFGGNTLTMVNLWGTYCGPCINEMPDLEVLNARLKAKGCGIIGVVVDVPSVGSTSQVQAAKEIIADTGVTYRNLLPWSGFDDAFPAQYIPTTYFVDSNGKIVGQAAVGARGADAYEALVDAVLGQLE